jgi:O-acetyl-ADP-ribose deacetylase (regulator of RNase III)
LEVATENGLKSISIPSISTGAFGYPIRLAAPVALETIVDYLASAPHGLDEVRMVLCTREDETSFNVYVKALEKIFAARTVS